MGAIVTLTESPEHVQSGALKLEQLRRYMIGITVRVIFHRNLNIEPVSMFGGLAGVEDRQPDASATHAQQHATCCPRRKRFSAPFAASRANGRHVHEQRSRHHVS